MFDIYAPHGWEIRNEIQKEYGDAYIAMARQQNPELERKRRRQADGGAFGMLAGVFGLALGAAGLFYGLPFALYVAASGVATGVAGVAIRSVSRKTEKVIQNLGARLLQEDIDNFKLVKSYFKDVLGREKEALDVKRKELAETQRYYVELLDRNQAMLNEKRAGALKIIAEGLNELEAQVRISRDDNSRFRRETEEALGEEFKAAAQKPAPQAAAGAAAPPQPRRKVFS